MPRREDETGRKYLQVIEKIVTNRQSGAGFYPKWAKDVGNGMESQGQEIEGGEHHGAKALAMPPIVLEFITMIFKDIEALVFDPPACAPGGNDGDCVLRR